MQNSKNKYVFIRYLNTQKGIRKEFLNIRHEWCIATSEALRFSTPKAASGYFMREDINQKLSVHTYIMGPKGGIYRAHDGSYVRE